MFKFVALCYKVCCCIAETRNFTFLYNVIIYRMLKSLSRKTVLLKSNEILFSAYESLKLATVVGPSPTGKEAQIAKFMGPTWGPPGSFRTQMGPMLTHEHCFQGHLVRILELYKIIINCNQSQKPSIPQNMQKYSWTKMPNLSRNHEK